MDYELVSLSQLQDADLKKLAALHHRALHTLLSDLGLPILSRYYQIARGDSSVVGICAINSSDEILGWAVGSPHPDRINSRLRTPLPGFMLQMLRLAFTRPLIVWQLVSSVFTSSGQHALEKGGIELTYIGVALGQRKSGVGKTLLNAFIEASRSKGYRSVVLSVETDNSAAIALYEKSGFKIARTYSEGRYQRHRMELILE